MEVTTKDKLSALISDIQEKVYELKTFDKTTEINGYCDELMSQVVLTFESATKHLNKIQQQLIDEINRYRDQLLDVLPPEAFAKAHYVDGSEDGDKDDSYGENDTDDDYDDEYEYQYEDKEDDIESSDDDGSSFDDEAKEEKPAVDETLDEGQVKQELEALSKKIQELSSQCSTHTASDGSGDNKEDQELAKLKAEADTYMQRCREIQTKLRDHAFQHKFMRFKENRLMTLQTDDVGMLEFSKTECGAKKDFKTPVVVETEMNSIRLSGYATKIAFLPNGLLAQCGHNEVVSIWDPKTGEEKMNLAKHDGRVTTIAVLPNGTLASAGREGNIIVWNLSRNHAKVINEIDCTSGQEIYLLKPLTNGYLASFSEDDVLEIWDPYKKYGKCILKLKHRGVDGGADVLSNGYFVTCTFNFDGECRLSVWNPKNGQLIKQIYTYIQNITSMCVLSNDEVVMGSLDGKLYIVNVLDGSQSSAIHDETKHTVIDTLMELPNGLLLVSQRGDDRFGFRECFLKIWNLQTGVIVQRFKAHDRMISCFCISNDHKFLATGAFDDRVKIWTLNL